MKKKLCKSCKEKIDFFICSIGHVKGIFDFGWKKCIETNSKHCIRCMSIQLKSCALYNGFNRKNNWIRYVGKLWLKMKMEFMSRINLTTNWVHFLTGLFRYCGWLDRCVCFCRLFLSYRRFLHLFSHCNEMIQFKWTKQISFTNPHSSQIKGTKVISNGVRFNQKLI